MRQQLVAEDNPAYSSEDRGKTSAALVAAAIRGLLPGDAVIGAIWNAQARCVFVDRCPVCQLYLNPPATLDCDVGWECECRATGGYAWIRDLAIKRSEVGFESTTVGPLVDVLDDLSALIRGYLFLGAPPSACQKADVLALWVYHTWCIAAANFTPYLAITSPGVRCGKSTLLDILYLLVRKPMLAANMTEAVLFRSIQQFEPTLLIDEADATFGKATESTEGIRAVLNAGFQRGRPVMRCVGPNYEVKEFDTFCPKAIAAIGDLPATVADRSIPIAMQRGNAEQRFIRRTVEAEARSMVAAMSTRSEVDIGALTDAEPAMPDVLDARSTDVCEPLIAIADLAGDTWPRRAREALVVLCAGKVDMESTGELLLRHIRAVFDEEGAERMWTEDILRALTERTDGPWARWWADDLSRTDEGGLKKAGASLARNLKPFGIRPSHKFKVGGVARQGYDRADFEATWNAYLDPVTAPTRARSDPDLGTTEPGWSEGISEQASVLPTVSVEQGSSEVPSPGGEWATRPLAEVEL